MLRVEILVVFVLYIIKQPIHGWRRPVGIRDEIRRCKGVGEVKHYFASVITYCGQERSDTGPGRVRD